jgi:predicted small secreted protein
MSSKVPALAMMIALFAALSACNTFEGMGEDIQSGGETLSGTASDVEQDMDEE